MRSFFAYILLFSIMLPTISPWGTIAYYRLNKEYIARALCENRERPQVMCYGKCYLAKVLKQQKEQEDKETAQRMQNLPVFQLFTQGTLHFLFKDLHTFPLGKTKFHYLLTVYTSPESRLLRPPRFV